MRFARALALLPFAAPLLVQGQILDVCAAVNVDLFALLGLVNLGGLLDVCLCVSALPLFVQTNAVAIIAADLVGIDAVVDALAKILIGAAGSKQCSFPKHASPICSASNPCGFNCTDGYVLSGKDCVCPAPKHDCNGKCTDAACPTGKLSKRDLYPLENLCGPGEQLCGLWAAGPHAWECLNTQRNLESCGGCVTPIPGARASGRDCTSIPGVASVECVYGECVVSRCTHGWKVNQAGNGCFNVQDSKAMFKNADVLLS
ncbi:hypothetical protein EXIGLDRAFT_727079 [Exidia glandulosa HHB12029]|uniref:Protein CPL1-like domain-containing protein n=1 Tax=Exidia glandulosa HHB12029 TaxID=1314781 RepID=A0A165M4H7_EXIGL|nr:hypothetical protein EXIGLDRAFT_727079 [Exidia glandulosa HHB12029]